MRLHKLFGVWQVDSMMPYDDVGRTSRKGISGLEGGRKVKRKLFLSFGTVLLALTLLAIPVGAFAAESEVATPSSDIDLAKKAGETFVKEIGVHVHPEWKAATLGSGTAYHDLQGNVISYLFGISRDSSPLGIMVVGSEAYNYSVLETAGGALPTIPSESEVERAVAETLGSKPDSLSKPMLVYLGVDGYYAVYDVGGQSVGFNLLSGRVYRTSELRSSLATPEQYRQYYKDSPNSEPSSEVLGIWGNPLTPFAYRDMSDPLIPEAYRRNNCGPTTGAMISAWWKQWYLGLQDWAADHNHLYITMYCNNWAPWDWGTAPWNFGPGFVQYASDCGHHNFDTDWCVNRAFSKIIDEIENGRPMGVMTSYFSPCQEWHWCAVKGYYDSATDWIIVNDPRHRPGDEGRYMDWGAYKASSVITRIWTTY